MSGIKRFRSAFVTYTLPAMAVLVIAWGYYKTSQTGTYLCQHSYALCTSALCIPQPGNHNQAICSCDVEEGPNMSTTPCNKLKPSTDAYGIQTLYSTFSLDQFTQGKKSMKCPDGTPWTWCLNKRCTVDPSNPRKAICVCDVMRSGEWTTLGGNCNTATCETGYWSGASLKDFDEGNAFMTRALGLDKSPAKWCQLAP
jgi:hypothetical protein